MGTRSVILFGLGWRSPYEVFYRHFDGYPTITGKELIEALEETAGLQADEAQKAILEALSYKTQKYSNIGREDIKTILQDVQGDLEWVYIIDYMRDPGPRRYLSIYKCAPWGAGIPFIWKAWGSYVDFFKVDLGENLENLDDKMKTIEIITHSQLNMIKSYHEANTPVAISQLDNVAPKPEKTEAA